MKLQQTTMLRNSKTPPFLVIGCLIFTLITIFNYWRVSNNNTYLKSNLIAIEDKMNSLILKKTNLEARSNEYEEKIKVMQKKISDNSELMLQKDSEISEVINKVNVAKEEIKQLKVQNWHNMVNT